MGTSSVIAFMENEEKYVSVLCNYDGYPDHVGKILCENYNTPEKIKELLSYGNMSTLGKEIGEVHNFNNRPISVCTFYNRDRNESNQESKRFQSLKDLKHYAETDYLYIYVVDKWMCFQKSKDLSYKLDEYQIPKEKENNV